MIKLDRPITVVCVNADMGTSQPGEGGLFLKHGEIYRVDAIAAGGLLHVLGPKGEPAWWLMHRFTQVEERAMVHSEARYAPAQTEKIDEVVVPGMSLRDWFAGMVIAGDPRGRGYADRALSASECADMARTAYALADAMLKEKARR